MTPCPATCLCPALCWEGHPPRPWVSGWFSELRRDEGSAGEGRTVPATVVSGEDMGKGGGEGILSSLGEE